MELPQQLAELNRIGLELFDFVTPAYLEEEISWVKWWEYQESPFDHLWEFLPGALGYKKPLSPKSFSIDYKGSGFTYKSLAWHLYDIVDQKGKLKILEENIEIEPGEQLGPGVFRYKFNKEEFLHEFTHIRNRISLAAVREIVEAFDTLDNGRRFYCSAVNAGYCFYYLLESEVADSDAMNSAKAPKLLSEIPKG